MARDEQPMTLRTRAGRAFFTASLTLLGCEGPAIAPQALEAPTDPVVVVDSSSGARSASTAPTATPSATVGASPPTERAPARVESLEVPNHVSASLVRSADGKPPRILFLPGICSNAGAYLHGFTEAAAAHGGAIAIEGDRPCGASKDFHSISSDPTHEEPRIDAALDAAGVPESARRDLIHVGYSLGATLLENLVKKRPERYRHVVLIGSPKDPRKDRLEKATTVATMSCSLDVPHRMKAAATMLTNAQVRAAYFEMPGCTHGNLADGDAVFGKVFSWVAGP
jgi:pimeloyl-ACP methyl ester carboxylesterase